MKCALPTFWLRVWSLRILIDLEHRSNFIVNTILIMVNGDSNDREHCF